MTKENEGERSEHRHQVQPRMRRRFSSDEVKSALEALFVLIQHVRGANVHPSLLAHALTIAARIVGVLNAAAADQQLFPSEGDDDGYEP